MATIELSRAYTELHNEATRLAGGLSDLAQRAAVYHHLFRHSGGNHAFPLIAAHGALWARGYFAFGMKLGRAMAWQYGLDWSRREAQLRCLAEFADAFRDINRRVCIDTYTHYHFAARWGNDPAAAEFIAPEMLAALQRLHAARREHRELSDTEKQEIFLTHFLNEQKLIVGPSIAAALAKFEWPWMKSLALRPIIHFAYFGPQQWLWFRNFADTEERIRNGLRAFRFATETGWEHVEKTLQNYAVLPPEFFAEPVSYFSGMRASVLRGATL